jgi:DNA-binding response OmpR family regulator
MTADRTATRRILVVDDNPDITGPLCAGLEALGHECLGAYDGLAALVGIDEFEPHVILLDLDMPCMDGFEVVERVRKRAGGDSMTIIAITGFDTPSVLDELRRAGIHHFLAKPFGLREIVELVGSVAATPPAAQDARPQPGPALSAASGVRPT